MNNKNTSTNLIPIDDSSVNSDMAEVTQKIIELSSSSDSLELINIFNWNLNKKNILRLYKLNQLEGNVVDAMLERFEKRSGEFTNDDLLHYMQTIETSIEKTLKNINNPDNTPTINVQNNTQVNLNVLDGFNSESKNRIADAIKSFLSNASNATNNDIIVNNDDDNN